VKALTEVRKVTKNAKALASFIVNRGVTRPIGIQLKKKFWFIKLLKKAKPVEPCIRKPKNLT
jgi:hypothetical protein